MPVAIRKETRKPCLVGTATPFTSFAMAIRMTALEAAEPIKRIRVLRPLTAPVSEARMAPVIRAGSEE
ncbi:hypothetical protein [Actinomadura sp. NTSP31]|uniref:hypothetical protein n=1 Tax=Actinomadura sp. NTSP31 TaxID=1735447 RepID=UPI0035BFA041